MKGDAVLMQPLVGIIMGSKSDWETMANAAQTLDTLGVPYEVRVVSAHRTPDLLFEYAESAESRGLEVIIAGAGGAAHLPGMTAAKTSLPVLGVPVESKSLKGIDSLLSIVQMPGDSRRYARHRQSRRGQCGITCSRNAWYEVPRNPRSRKTLSAGANPDGSGKSESSGMKIINARAM